MPLETNPVEISYQLRTLGVARAVPSNFKAPDVEGVSPTVDDVALAKKARSLLVEASTRIGRVGGFSDSLERADWAQGATAFADGRYIEAIAHFHSELER